VDFFPKKLAKLVERKKKGHLAKEIKTPNLAKKNQCSKRKMKKPI